MPYGYGSYSDDERDSYDAYSDDEPTENDLFYELKDSLSYDYSCGIVLDRIKSKYDKEIRRFSNSFLSSALKGLTSDEYFTQHWLPYFKDMKSHEDFLRECELEERREYESSPEYFYKIFYDTVTNLIHQSNVAQAREIYDAEISQHISFLPDGVTPETFFDRLVEEDAEIKAHLAREAEEARLSPLREKYVNLRQLSVREMTRHFGDNIRTYYQNFLGLTGLGSIADCQIVRHDPDSSFESEYLTLVAEAAKNRVGHYIGRGPFIHAFGFREEEGRFIPLYNSVEGDKALFLERVVPELIAYFSQYLCPSDYVTERYTTIASTRPYMPSRVPTEFDIPTFVRDLIDSPAFGVTYGDLLFETVSRISKILLAPPPKPAPTQMERDTWEIQRIWDDLSLDLSVKKDATRGFRLKYGDSESVRIMKSILYFMSEEQIISFVR